MFSFVKLPRIEPPKDGVYGCVLAALRKIKKGTVEEVTEQAMKEGLHKATKQNPKIQTQIKLRRLVRLGSAKKERVHGDKKKDESVKPTSKSVEKKEPEKKPVEKKAAVKKKAAPKKVKAAPKAVPVDEEREEDYNDPDAPDPDEVGDDD